MNQRERVETALNHEKPDRCPFQASFTPEFASRLRSEIGLSDSALHNPHGGGNTYLLERSLNQDLLLTSVGWANSYYSEQSEIYIDEWGVGWKHVPYETPFGAGTYTEITEHPLEEDEKIASYRPPDPERPELYREAERVVEEYRGEYWIVGVTVTTIFETAWALRGYEKILSDLVLNPDLVEALFEIPYKYHLVAAKRLVRMGVDMIWLGDDVGTQDRMLFSPVTWRRFLKPRMAELIGSLKDLNPALKVAYHSDGEISPIIPELIEIGVDVLNPIQPASMSPSELKTRYGDKLCFWGTIDEQHTLPFGSPDDVRNEVLRRLETVGRDGGLILGPTHHVQLDTPMENFRALVDTVMKTPC
jgi:uroporphyrinogen decarboxylase